MARHRDSSARRRISRGPVIAVALVVVVMLAVLGWLRLRDNIAAQRVSASDNCVSGPSSLDVTANNTIAPALTELADRFTATNTVIRDHCIRVAVHPAADQQVLAGLQGTWDSATLGAPPAAWVPQDSSWTTQLSAAKPARLPDKVRSLATSPVLLAVPQPAAQAIATAKLSWADLPTLQSTPAGWARFGQPSWGTLTIATPTGRDGATTAALVVQAVAAGLSDTAPVTTAALRRPDISGALAALQLRPAQQPGDTTAALAAIHGLRAVPGSPFQAVPALEQQIFTTAQQPGSTALAGVPLAGPTPAADFPLAGIKAPWVDDTQSRAASAFGQFLGRPEQQKVLAGAGFRAGGAQLPAGTPAVRFAPVPNTLAPPDAATSAAVNAALAAAPRALTATVLLDVSSSMSARENGVTRLQATTSALRARIDGLPDSAGVGLSTFSTDLDNGLPYRVDVATGALSESGLPSGSRRQSLDAVLRSLTPKTGNSLYFSLAATYRGAVQGFTGDHANSVLLITDARNDGRTSLSELQSAIDRVRDAAKPVRIDIVAIGSQPDIATLTQLTAQTGGTLVRTGIGDLPAAVSQLLG